MQSVKSSLMWLVDWFMRHRWAFIVAFHAALTALSSYTAMWLRFDGGIPALERQLWVSMLPALVFIRALTFMRFRLYQGLWRYTGVWDLRNIVVAVTVSSVIFYVFVHVFMQEPRYPRSAFVIDALILTFLMGASRLMRRIRRELFVPRTGRRVLIFGAGDAGEMIVRDMRAQPGCDYQPIGFVDDDQLKIGRRIHGVPVLGTTHDLPKLVMEHYPEEVLVAISSARTTAIRHLVRVLEPFKVPITTIPNFKDILNGRVAVNDIRTLAAEDLLPRLPVGLDQRPLRQLVEGKRILITGAGGSIGSELATQIAALHPARLTMCDRYENGLFDIVSDLQDRGLGSAVVPIIADVTDATRVEAIFDEHRPEIVFHAAAHKHVPLMESNPSEAVKNNVTGTRLVLDAAIKAGTQRFILISTDKAVNPSSVMGATKRVGELLLQSRTQQGGKTMLCAVRFGNVLASNGSVVPRFLKQIKSGGPVTVTHAEIRRYFMLIPEAVQLVLHAAAHAQSGGTYVLEMGEQVRLADLARNLIRLSGFVPDREIAIKFVGLRPGEKMYEELVGADETALASGIQKVQRVESAPVKSESLLQSIARLEALALRNADSGVLEELHTILPNYRSPEVTSEALEVGEAVAVPPELTASIACPSCTGPVHRSRARSVKERLAKRIGPARPYACDQCGWRGMLMPPVIPERREAEISVMEPNWSELDAVTAIALHRGARR